MHLIYTLCVYHTSLLLFIAAQVVYMHYLAIATRLPYIERDYAHESPYQIEKIRRFANILKCFSFDRQRERYNLIRIRSDVAPQGIA